MSGSRIPPPPAIFEIRSANNMADPGLARRKADPLDMRNGLGVTTHAMTRKSAELARAEVRRLMRAPGR